VTEGHDDGYRNVCHFQKSHQLNNLQLEGKDDSEVGDATENSP